MIKVLMLGWELPPLITGGLGMACEGILKGFEKQNGAKIKFVMPKSPGFDVLHGTAIVSLEKINLTNLNLGDVFGEVKSSYSSELISEVFEFSNFISNSCSDYDFDLVHAHDWLTIPAALELKKIFGKPLVLHLHSCEFDRSGPMPNQLILDVERAGILAADSIVVVSEFMRRRIVKNFGIPSQRISVIHNSTNICFAGNRANFNEKPIISFIGRMTYQKGPLAFVEAARKILNLGLDFQFVMAGDGDMLDEVIDRVGVLGLSDNFVFKGFLDQEGVVDLLSYTSVFVMPSISEPFGIVALEAATGQVPSVLSKYSGVTEVLNGVIKVDPFNISEIANAIVWCARNQADARLMAKQAFSEAKDVSWESAASLAIELYRGVLEASALREGVFG